MASDPSSSPRIQSIDDLEATFHAGSKPRDAWRIGVEYEKPVVDSATGESVPYDGPRGIAALLDGISRESPRWKPVREGNNVIALEDGLASITLEPGGQLEMSGQQCDSLHCANRELEEHVREILAAGSPLGQRFLGLGIAPKTPLERIPWMPKQRYRIMREIMGRTGTLGRRMMAQTATVQCNFDYGDEADALLKMRVSLAMGPLLVAMSANSPVVDGKPTGYQSYRAHIWSDTDADRCGFLPFVFRTESLFGAYTQYALDVPMYFVWRDGRYKEVGGLSFRRFLAEGFDGKHATMADWTLHLTTLFPEVRLKRYLEMRGADSGPLPALTALPALWVGLLYDQSALDAAWDVVKGWSIEDHDYLRSQTPLTGLATKFQGLPLSDLAREVVKIAHAGLRARKRLDAAGNDETIYLAPLDRAAASGQALADELLAKWKGEWKGSFAPLFRDYAY